jgi:hypothetical protein
LCNPSTLSEKITVLSAYNSKKKKDSSFEAKDFHNHFLAFRYLNHLNDKINMGERASPCINSVYKEK